MKLCKNLKGGLQEVADQLELRRVGPQHQAGSDSHLTGMAFFKIKEVCSFYNVTFCGAVKVINLVSHTDILFISFRSSLMEISRAQAAIFMDWGLRSLQAPIISRRMLKMGTLPDPRSPFASPGRRRGRTCSISQNEWLGARCHAATGTGAIRISNTTWNVEHSFVINCDKYYKCVERMEFI